jgi:hypothetical protein
MEKIGNGLLYTTLTLCLSGLRKPRSSFYQSANPPFWAEISNGNFLIRSSIYKQWIATFDGIYREATTNFLFDKPFANRI